MTWTSDPASWRALAATTVVFVAGFLFHNADHLRRGAGSLSGEVLTGGTLLTIASALAVALVLLGHRLAPVVASVVGFAGAVGVAATHLLPHWSSFSDSFPDGHVDALSWAAVVSEIVALLLFGAAGVYVRRRVSTHVEREPRRDGRTQLPAGV